MASDVTPTETSLSSFTPSAIGSSNSVARFPQSMRKVKPRLGTRARPPSEADRSTAKTSLVKLPPPTSGQESAKHRQEPDPSHKDTESVLLHKIQELEYESRKLRGSCARLERELSNNSSQLSYSNQQKEAAQRERDIERNNKVEVLAILEDQKAILDEYRSNFVLQKGILDEVENEHDTEKTSKAELQAKLEESEQVLDGFKYTYKLGMVLLARTEKERDEIQEARDGFQKRLTLLEEELTKLQKNREQQSRTLMQKIDVLEITRDALQEQRDNRDREISNLVATCSLLKTERETLIAQMATATGKKKVFEDKMQKVKESLGNKGKVQGASGEEQAAIRKAIVNKELQALKARVEELEKQREELEQAKTTLEEGNSDLKTKLEAAKGELHKLNTRTAELESSASSLSTKMRITNLTAEADRLREQAAGLESDKSGLQEKVNDLKTSKLEKQLQLDTLNTDLAGAKAANNVSLASQKLDKASELSGVLGSLGSTNAETEALCSSWCNPQLAEALADYISSEKVGDIEDAQLAQVLNARLLDLLGAFPPRFRGAGSSDAERKVMSFIHKHRG